MHAQLHDEHVNDGVTYTCHTYIVIVIFSLGVINVGLARAHPNITSNIHQSFCLCLGP